MYETNWILYVINCINNTSTDIIKNIISKLDALSPLKTLKRGYTITKKDDKVITSIKNIKKGDNINIEFNDGDINAKVVWKKQV